MQRNAPFIYVSVMEATSHPSDSEQHAALILLSTFSFDKKKLDMKNLFII